MTKDADSDLQTWISFIMQRSKKLKFLGKEVPDEELVVLFLKGLHPVFRPLQIHFAVPGQLPKTLADLIVITRKFASDPIVALELSKLKSSGSSQNMFPAVTTPQPNKKPVCIQFSRNGTCRFGARCKFVHTTTPAARAPEAPQPPRTDARPLKCDFCQNRGHTIDVCRASNAAATPKTTSVLLSEILLRLNPKSIRLLTRSKLMAMKWRSC